MDTLIDFLLNNYVWFIIISLILIFALIGYLVDTTAPKKKKVKPIVNNDKMESDKVHPAIEAYTNEKFDKPLIEEEK